jgi:hypothetical protein
MTGIPASSAATTDVILTALVEAGWEITDVTGRDPSDPTRVEHPQHGSAWIQIEEDE